MFVLTDEDKSGHLSCKEVIVAVKQAYDILGKLNCDYNQKGIEVFREMDANGDMKISLEEFINAATKDPDLCQLLEQGLGFNAILKQQD